jgi:hypothetical protein
MKKFKKSKKFILLSGIIVVLVIILSFVGLNYFRGMATDSLNLEYTLSNGYRINYNSNWNVEDEGQEGLIFTNKEGVAIFIAISKVENSDQTLDNIVNERTNLLKKDNLDVKVNDVTINNIKFKEINVEDKGDQNIKTESLVRNLSTLDNGNYISIGLFYEKGQDITKATKIIESIKK